MRWPMVAGTALRVFCCLLFSSRRGPFKAFCPFSFFLAVPRSMSSRLWVLSFACVRAVHNYIYNPMLLLLIYSPFFKKSSASPSLYIPWNIVWIDLAWIACYFFFWLWCCLRFVFLLLLSLIDHRSFVPLFLWHQHLVLCYANTYGTTYHEMLVPSI